MEKLGLNTIRRKFLDFFESKDHQALPSFPLVPQNDPSLLLINAGMAPLKNYFTGKEVPPNPRMASCQKCIRTLDIELVGKTARHGTFFEMLGNFSFGDYFKKEAILWAWEFCTTQLMLPVDRLWVSIYLDDDEAFEIWTKDAGVDPGRIVRLGKEDNFWEIGTGPCGPCSEIYFDRGEQHSCSPECKMGCDCDRFVEFWNLVFTQFDRDQQGNYNKLAKPNIDTGMGLERIAAIMQGVDSLFEVDTIKCVIDAVAAKCKTPYATDKKTDVSLRVITDHIRSTVFLVADGVIPSNEGRGYVLRRLLRRAARHLRLIGVSQQCLGELAAVVIETSREAYPQLEDNRAYIEKTIRIEEERFAQTIDQGEHMLNDLIKDLKSQNKKVLDGASAFKLYDTFGFPIDLTVEIIGEQGISVDTEQFRLCMEDQRTRARAARGEDGKAGWSGDGPDLSSLPATKFLGCDARKAEATVLATGTKEQLTPTLKEGQTGLLVTDSTPFYPAGGGQVGDEGIITCPSARLKVNGVGKDLAGRIIHEVHCESGSIKAGDICRMEINVAKRLDTERNHSATHILHKALKEILGEHIAQAGSLVSPERLRFDFSHPEALTKQQLDAVEDAANKAVMSAMPVEITQKSIKDARQMGATALFGEKYGEVVRVVAMGDYSVELCGGAHVRNTAEIGCVKIISESSAAAGVRRIEALTGMAVVEYMREKDRILDKVTALTKANSHGEVSGKIETMLELAKESVRVLSTLRSRLAKSDAEQIVKSAVEIGGTRLFRGVLKDMTIEQLRGVADSIKETSDTYIIVLASLAGDKISFVGMASRDMVEKGVHMGKLIGSVAKLAGGSGGGRPDSAQGAGKHLDKLTEALECVLNLVKG